MNEVQVNFNNQQYLATYNEQTGYYEVEITAPNEGGIYNTDVLFTDLLGVTTQENVDIQVFVKEKIKIDTNKVFMWIFDYKDFKVKDIIEIADYDINIDEETNANSTIKVLKKTSAKAKDIVAIKQNNQIVFWGIIDNIKNENGKKLYEYILKYITNMFDEKVMLSNNVDNNVVEDGIYRIKSALDTKKVLDVTNASMEAMANVQLWENNNSDAQKWQITKNTYGFYTIKCIMSNKVLDVAGANYANETNIQQYDENNNDAQKWKIERMSGAYYKIKTKLNNFAIDVAYAKTDNGTNIQIYDATGDATNQRFVLEKLEEQIIKTQGIEDYIAKVIKDNFISNKDTYINREYLEVRVKTHTKIQTSVSNVQDNIYNLHTWMANCTQLYNINYNFFIENKKLIIEIENKSLDKELIDVKAQAISNYTEVFETNIVSKVEVATDTQTYYLYLLNDRTTTTDATNENRAEGITERVYTANYDEAEQKALDTIQANRYNHNITFYMIDKYMKVGTPIAIKTKESTILDTYISAIKLTQKKLYEYTCGNMRVKFIDKLLKERK